MKNDGFTILEIIMVFSILGILLMLSVPKLTTNFGYMDRMAEELLNDVRFVQMEAMKYPTPKYKISVGTDNRKYLLMDEHKIVKTVLFKKRYELTYTGTGDLYFTIEGEPANAGTFTIKDTETNELKSVTIIPATGRTIILE